MAHRREIDEQLERRPRLPDRLRRAIIVGGHIILAPHHRAHRTVAIEADERALRARRRIVLDRGVGLSLHAEIQRRPDLERRLRLVDQRIELRQGPVGEVADRILLGFGRELQRLRIGGGGFPR